MKTRLNLFFESFFRKRIEELNSDDAQDTDSVEKIEPESRKLRVKPGIIIVQNNPDPFSKESMKSFERDFKRLLEKELDNIISNK